MSFLKVNNFGSLNEEATITDVRKPMLATLKNAKRSKAGQLKSIKSHRLVQTDADIDDFHIDRNDVVKIFPAIPGKPRTNKGTFKKFPNDQTLVLLQTDALDQEAQIMNADGNLTNLTLGESQIPIATGTLFMEDVADFRKELLWVHAVTSEIPSNTFEFKIWIERFSNGASVKWTVDFKTVTFTPALLNTIPYNLDKSEVRISAITDLSKNWTYLLAVFVGVPNAGPGTDLHGVLYAAKLNYATGVIDESSFTVYGEGTNGALDLKNTTIELDDTDEKLRFQEAGGDWYEIDKDLMVYDDDGGTITPGGSEISRFYTLDVVEDLFSTERFTSIKSAVISQSNAETYITTISNQETIWLAISYLYTDGSYSPLISKVIGSYKEGEFFNVDWFWNQVDLTIIDTENNISSVSAGQERVTLSATFAWVDGDRAMIYYGDERTPQIDTITRIGGSPSDTIQFDNLDIPTDVDLATAWCHKVDKFVDVFDEIEEVYLWGSIDLVPSIFSLMDIFAVPPDFSLNNQITLRYSVLGADTFNSFTGREITDVLGVGLFYRFIEIINKRIIIAGAVTPNETEAELSKDIFFQDGLPREATASSTRSRMQNITFVTGMVEANDLAVLTDPENMIMTDGNREIRRFKNMGTINFNGLTTIGEFFYFIHRTGIFRANISSLPENISYGRIDESVFGSPSDIQFKEISAAHDVIDNVLIVSVPHLRRLFCIDLDDNELYESTILNIDTIQTGVFKLRSFNGRVYGIAYYALDPDVSGGVLASTPLVLLQDRGDPVIVELFTTEPQLSLPAPVGGGEIYDNGYDVIISTIPFDISQVDQFLAKKFEISYTSKNPVQLQIDGYDDGEIVGGTSVTLPINTKKGETRIVQMSTKGYQFSLNFQGTDDLQIYWWRFIG